MTIERTEKTTTEATERIKTDFGNGQSLEIKRVTVNGKAGDIFIIIREESMYTIDPSSFYISKDQAKQFIEVLSVFLKRID